MEVIEVNKDSFWKYLYIPLRNFFLILGSVFLMFFLVKGFKEGVDIDKFINMMFITFLFTFILNLLPSLFLFTFYYINDKDLCLEIHDEFLKIKKGENYRYLYYKDIDKIEINMKSAKYEERVHWLYWDNFFYYEIILKNGSSFKITCLIYDNDDKFIENVKKIKKKVFIPIWW